ncbi:MAG: 2-oxoacid:acceptor oxidoreductase family protein, partial [Anaerolineae bacterium]
MTRQSVTIDGNEAAAYVAHKTNEVIAIYPITPSSPMAEHCDEWSSWGRANVWGSVPHVVEMQSEGGAAGATHGSLQTGSLTTSFTSSQGLLLWIPNMFKIAGELLPCVLHIAARAIATHALSIFGDHADVMAARMTGWAMLFGNSVQETHDFALIAQAATLESRVPFMNIMDGFRTSHEVAKIVQVSDEEIRAMMDDRRIAEHRARALSPDHPVTRGTAQNPDVFFQNREAANRFYLAVPDILQQTMDRFAAVAGRAYHLFDYVGAPDAERVVVLMGSACETAQEAVEYLAQRGEKVGAVKVRLYRPFARQAFLQALPETTRAIAVLDRTKEPGALGEPLYEEVVTAIGEAMATGQLRQQTPVRIIGGRYGLSSKEFTPAMVKAVLDELGKAEPANHFTVGIDDDVTHTSLEYDRSFTTEPADVFRGVFWGFGSDGTVGANKNSIKIIGEATDNHAQGYFVYDSKKAGAHTISHLRFGPRPIRSTYLIEHANFIGVHQFGFLERFHIIDAAVDGATLLLNTPYEPEHTWDALPRSVQEQIIAKHLIVYAINAYAIAQSV